ncbi:hypothetical protein K458DRAFT_424452 [Lentithecium fluviatile CBS 122367]|uniref:Uncharacterized protein n=1 Tax=Lentithecium fluviatile CBS 122367 TaxID=1168545 RepID=A0A6G1IFM5_9PLEO|nr:hypothetical protein K458DRAFT_424452 [Lentithecium fluviatile CBS 122367]
MIPLNTRKYLGHIVTLPSPNYPNDFSTLGGTVYYDEGNLILRGAFLGHRIPDSPTDPANTPSYESPGWLASYAADTALVNECAQEENFK